MKWTLEKRRQLSKLYDINWSRMSRESQKCSCTQKHGTTSKCSNPKHWFYVKRERELQKLSVQATEQLSTYINKELKSKYPDRVLEGEKNTKN